MQEKLSVWYVELKGENALDALRGVLNSLPSCPGFLGAELLTSPEQPGMALIASRWAREIPDVALPDGAKHWAFQVVASAVP